MCLYPNCESAFVRQGGNVFPSKLCISKSDSSVGGSLKHYRWRMLLQPQSLVPLQVLQIFWSWSLDFQDPSLFLQSAVQTSPFFFFVSFFFFFCSHFSSPDSAATLCCFAQSCAVLGGLCFLCCCFYHLEQPLCNFLPHQLSISSTFVSFKVGFLICICLLIFSHSFIGLMAQCLNLFIIQCLYTTGFYNLYCVLPASTASLYLILLGAWECICYERQYTI